MMKKREAKQIIKNLQKDLMMSRCDIANIRREKSEVESRLAESEKYRKRLTEKLEKFVNPVMIDDADYFMTKDESKEIVVTVELDRNSNIVLRSGEKIFHHNDEIDGFRIRL